MKSLKDQTKVLLVSYFAFSTRANNGPGTPAILQYLKKRVKRIAIIEHPFPSVKDQHSYLSIFVNGRLVFEKKIRVPKGPDWLKYLFHILFSVYFVLISKSFYDLCIGVGNFALFPIIPFRFISISRLIYYTFDYTPNRFPSKILNKIYFWIDQITYKTSDINWVVNKYANQNRIKNGFNTMNIKKPHIVPLGYDRDIIKVKSINQIDYFSLIFSGALLEISGPQLIIKTMPLILEKYPKMKLIITGSGEYEIELKRLIKRLNLEKHIKFLGFIQDFNKLTKIVTNCSIGIAPYKPDLKAHTKYADPSKLKLYLACRLPVITTGVATISRQIKMCNAGVIIDFEEYSLLSAINQILSNKISYLKFKQGSINLSKKYDIKMILDKAFNNL